MKNDAKKQFGRLVLSDKVLKKYMPFFWFEKYKKQKASGEGLDEKVASLVAKAAKRWATRHGATHFSHWFVPIGGKSAGKFINFLDIKKTGRAKFELDAKSLVMGETDASSFPNGGERSTFEARGYTIWDHTSPMFLEENQTLGRVLFIPTAYCSYGGVALDEKTPLLRAGEALNKQALRVLHHLGRKDKRVVGNIGVEQEYFLLKREVSQKRLDLTIAGRTLFGCEQIKTQETNAHYFCALNDEVGAFFSEVDKALCQKGVLAKLQHCEAAPCQFEIVQKHCVSNVASDQNQVVMNTLLRVAKKQGFEVLFHEKPFEFVNGSGKHLNWSLSNNLSENLFDSNTSDNLVFMVFFAATVAAIDEFSELLQQSTAGRGNDLRLGEKEAPPAQISLFVGDEIQNMFLKDKSDCKKSKYLEHGVKTLPKTKKDVCDRNRTSPLAFCGDRFEFRMVGSSSSVAWPCSCLNLALAKVLGDVADVLDSVESDKRAAARVISKELFQAHKRIIFDGNAYGEEWKTEAEKRGLGRELNCVECADVLGDKKIVEAFEKLGVMSECELKIRQNAALKTYLQTVGVEAKTMCEMLTKQIYPSLLKTKKFYAAVKNDLFLRREKAVLRCFEKLTVLQEKLEKNILYLGRLNAQDGAKFSRDAIVPLMEAIRKEFDDIEPLFPEHFKPFPNQNDLLFAGF